VRITIRDNLGNIVEAMESAITACSDFRPMWADLRRPWEVSRLRMFHTAGRSIGHPWPGYEDTFEADWYVWWKAGVLDIDIQTPADMDRLLLRWPTANERMFPSLVDTRSQWSVWRAGELSLEMGSKLAYVGQTDAGSARRAPREMGGHIVPRRRLLSFGRQFVADTGKAMGVQAGRIANAVGDGVRIRSGFTSSQVLARLTGRIA
jgi:hypothetical protein